MIRRPPQYQPQAQEAASEKIDKAALRKESSNSDALGGRPVDLDLTPITESATAALEQNPTHSEQESKFAWVFNFAIPILATSILSAAIVMCFLKYSGALVQRPPRIVTFDVIKYENAEKAAALKLMGKDGAGAVAPMLSYASKRLKAAVREAAGPGTLVVLAQAVVQGQKKDITDEVLKTLGLPTNAPTVSPAEASTLAITTDVPRVMSKHGSLIGNLMHSTKTKKASSIVP